jgi:hypothetical protein
VFPARTFFSATGSGMAAFGRIRSFASFEKAQEDFKIVWFMKM